MIRNSKLNNTTKRLISLLLAAALLTGRPWPPHFTATPKLWDWASPVHGPSPWTILTQKQSVVSDYAYEAMCWLTMHGIITGDENNHPEPGATVTRAETAVIFQRFVAVAYAG